MPWSAHFAQMVNAKFPGPGDYGFQMVHAPEFFANPASMEYLRRIKSAAFFPNFLRFDHVADTGDLSTAAIEEQDCEINRNGDKGITGSRDVFPASHGILARARAGAAAQRENTRIGQAAAGGRLRSRVGSDRGGVRHESVLQTPAGGLRSRRPGRDRDRPARP